MAKVYDGTNPAVDQSTAYSAPAGVTVPSNIDFDGESRGIDELVVQIDALIVKKTAQTLTADDRVQWSNLMRQLGFVLQHTSPEGFGGAIAGGGASTLQNDLLVAFGK
jgi:hypothetical protein